MQSPSYKQFGNLQTAKLVRTFAKILLEIEPVMKEGKTKEGKTPTFPYLRILELANVLREKLFRKGILILPDDSEFSTDSWESEGRRYQNVVVSTLFTITDGRDAMVFSSYGEGQSCDGLAMAAAQTMALKAFLKRLGLIFGDFDDQEIGEHPAPVQIAQPSYNERAFQSALNLCGRSAEEAAEFLSHELGRTLTAEMVVCLPPKKFNDALELLMNGTELTKRLEDSIGKVREKRGKAQPVVRVMDRRNGEESVAGD